MILPDAEWLAKLEQKIDMLERARKLELEEVDRLRGAVVKLEQLAEEQDVIIRALRVAARGAS